MTIEQLYQLYVKHPRISTDSRQVGPGDLFFALKGDKFDGNQFALQALAAGAARAIVDDPALANQDRCLYVENSLQTLQQLARHHRRQFDIPLIAITGSNGKTTTKELIKNVMCSHYPCHFTKGNLNNHIGVPLTLLAMPRNVEVAIIEMGANHQGEIDFLCQIAEPTHGLITNIGQAHLEGFGGLEGVKKGKSELYNYLTKTGGVAFINRDAAWLSELAEVVKKKVFYFKSKKPDIRRPGYEVVLLKLQPHIQIAFLDENGKLLNINSHLIGQYNFDNIMSAVALGKYFKVPVQKIKSAIASYVPSNNRSQILQQGDLTFIMDAYNANPSSMEAALLNFAQVKASKKIAILGDMLELGDFAPAAHAKIAKLAMDQALDQIILVGKLFSEASKQYSLTHFERVEDLIHWWKTQDKSNCHILLKGSRGVQLEKILET